MRCLRIHYGIESTRVEVCVRAGRAQAVVSQNRRERPTLRSTSYAQAEAANSTVEIY